MDLMVFSNLNDSMILVMRLPVFQPQSRLSIRRGLRLQDRMWWGAAIVLHAVPHPMGEEKRAASCNPEMFLMRLLQCS